jgi:hypothetical protein
MNIRNGHSMMGRYDGSVPQQQDKTGGHGREGTAGRAGFQPCRNVPQQQG